MKKSIILSFAVALVLAAWLGLPRAASAGCEPDPEIPNCQICTDNPDTGCCTQVAPCRCRDEQCWPFAVAPAFTQAAQARPDWWTAIVAPVSPDAGAAEGGCVVR